MPNWVYTSLEVTGPSEELSKFIAGIKKGKKDEYTDTRYLEIISSYIPCPTELYEVTSPLKEEQKEFAAIMLENYGSANWYDWQHDNWGVKWGDCNTFIDEQDEASVKFRFETPWGTAEKAFLKISSMFPELIFLFSYEEEAGFFCGAEVMSKGEMDFSEMFSPSEYEGEVDWDSMEGTEKYDEWVYTLRSDIDTKADTVVGLLTKAKV